MKTLVTLFSSAGVGDYGFKMAGFETVATNEFLEERLNIQKMNKKCKYETGYVLGDITLESTKQQIMDEIAFWENAHGIKTIDALVATPPCQGMSTANYKKGDETPRNSLVIESLELIDKISPRYFILENVRAFLETVCFNKLKNDFTSIDEAIDDYLESKYNIYRKVINFKEYGVPSSRPRTLVIGTRKDMPNLSPLLVFPDREKPITLKEAIGDFPSLTKFNEFPKNNPLHMFREYPEYMREWISPLKEGQSSFELEQQPFKIVDGKKQTLRSAHLGNKFSRMYWNEVAPAIHTRTDQLASNRTIHPSDDRVLSVAELMKVMSIPESFKWFELDDFAAAKDKVKFLRKVEPNIRRSIGEAVPTKIFYKIASNIIKVDKDPFDKLYKMQYESDRMGDLAAFYTPQSVVFNVLKNIDLSKFKKEKIKILEPSAGWGSFLPQIAKFFQGFDNVEITLNDLDKEAIKAGKKMFSSIPFPSNISIKWQSKDFMLFDETFDFVIGNPPYMVDGNSNLYTKFIRKAIEISDNISFIVPKTIINSDIDADLRQEIISKHKVNSYIEFGVRTFNNVFIETAVITLQTRASQYTKVSRYFGKTENKKQGYIVLEKIWAPYRDDKFDELLAKLKLNVFESYRDRQLTNKFMSSEKQKYWIIRSKNLEKDKVKHVDGYDRFIDDVSKFTVSRFANKNIIIVPNFTYNFRAASLPKNAIANGSIVFLTPKIEIDVVKTKKLFNSEEFNHYYGVLQSFSKFTININKSICHYLGVLNES